MSLANKFVKRSAKAPLWIGHVRLGAGVGRGQLRPGKRGEPTERNGLSAPRERGRRRGDRWREAQGRLLFPRCLPARRQRRRPAGNVGGQAITHVRARRRRCRSRGSFAPWRELPRRKKRVSSPFIRDALGLATFAGSPTSDSPITMSPSEVYRSRSGSRSKTRQSGLPRVRLAHGSLGSHALSTHPLPCERV